MFAIISEETLSFHRYVTYWRGVPAIVMGIGWLGLAVAIVSWLCLPQGLRYARVQDLGAFKRLIAGGRPTRLKRRAADPER